MTKQEPIAVVGMAGLFPGAPDLETFWQNIIHKSDVIRPVSPERWRVHPDTMITSTLTPDKAYSENCGLINNFKFDPYGLDLDRNFALELDPLLFRVLRVVNGGRLQRKIAEAIVSLFTVLVVHNLARFRDMSCGLPPNKDVLVAIASSVFLSRVIIWCLDHLIGAVLHTLC